MQFLLIADNTQFGSILHSALTERGFIVSWASTSEDAIRKLPASHVVLLDLSSLNVDGLRLCAHIRSTSDVAIVALSASGAIEHRIRGLRAGADDYLVKPFHLEELLARIDAIWRRYAEHASERQRVVHIDDLEIDLDARKAELAGKVVELTPMEFRILAMITSSRGHLCYRDKLLLELWGDYGPRASRALYVHINKLRAKLGNPGLIVTVRGRGYRFAGRSGRVPSKC